MLPRLLEPRLQMESFQIAAVLVGVFKYTPPVGAVPAASMGNVLAQIGFVVLVSLAAKNAVLIAEFARQAQDAGRERSRVRGARGPDPRAST